MGQCASRPKPLDDVGVVKGDLAAKGAELHDVSAPEPTSVVKGVSSPPEAPEPSPASAEDVTLQPVKKAPKGKGEVISAPDTGLILNMLDHENGPAAGLAYKVHYLGPPRPPCESDRLLTVKALGDMDTMPKDPEITSILKLCSSVFKAPAALCALFDEKRVFVSQQEGDVVPCGDFPWRWTLCGWSMAFKNPQVLVIEDTMKDVRFTTNPKCTVFPKVRFYCGAPLIASNGHRLGTLCFADIKPRHFDAASCVLMNNLSELVVRQLEKDIAVKLKDKDNKALATTYQSLQRTMDCFDQCVVLLDTSVEGWRIVYANATWTRQTGLPHEGLIGSLLSDTLESTSTGALPTKAMLESAAAMRSTKISLARVKDPNVTKTFSLKFRPAGRQGLDDNTLTLGVPSFLPATGGEDMAQHYYFMVMTPFGQKQSSIISSTIAPSVSLALSSGRSSNASSVGNVDGLELGHLLGRGSFGWVYYGTWFGTPVAVKVVDEDVRPVMFDPSCSASSMNVDGPSPAKEAVMAKELRHPNIVATLKYVVRSVPKGRVPTWDDYMVSKDDINFKKDGSENKHGTSECSNEVYPVSDSEDAPCGACDSAKPCAIGNGWAVMAWADDKEEGGAQLDALEEEGEDGELVQAAPSAAIKSMKDGEVGRKMMHNVEVSSRGNPDTSAGSSVTVSSMSSSAMQQTWMLMEFCDKGCIQDAVDRGWLRTTPDCLESKPNMEAVLVTGIEIASAMRYLHAHDVVHGDLTAWNVMLSSTGAGGTSANRGFVAKVADFGLSRSLEMKNRITTRTYGTLTHMPPEVLKDGVVSRAMDVYSFGVLLWQMFTGSRPWSGLTHAQIIMKVVQQKMTLQWDDDAPANYRSLAESCMAYDPEDRPTFSRVVDMMEALKEEL